MVGTLKPAVQDLGQQVLPFLKRLTPQEVLSIWGHLSNHVLRQLSLHKGVQIPGFGTFSFGTEKTVMGKKKFIPIFIVDKKLMERHGLKQDQIDVPGDIPVFPLDFDMISMESSFRKDLVKHCVKGTVHHLSRFISTSKRVIFHLTGIGVLTIEGTKVQMRFFEDLTSVLDRTWAMEEAVANRPGKVDSMMSSSKTSGKPPRFPLIFQRTQLKESEKRTPVKTLVADGQLENNGEEVVREKHARSPLKLPVVILPRPMPDNAGGGKIGKPERFPSPHYMKNGNKMNPKYSPAHRFLDHNEEMCDISLEPAQSNITLNGGNKGMKNDGDGVQFYQHYKMSKDEEDLLKHQIPHYSQHLHEEMNNRRQREIKQRLTTQLVDHLEHRQPKEQHLTDRTAEGEQRKRMSQSLQEDRKKSILQKRQRDKAFQRTSTRLFHLEHRDGYQLHNQCQKSSSKKGETRQSSHNLLLHGSRVA